MLRAYGSRSQARASASQPGFSLNPQSQPAPLQDIVAAAATAYILMRKTGLPSARSISLWRASRWQLKP